MGTFSEWFDFTGDKWFKLKVNYDFLKQLEGAHLLVAGEIGIDEYIWGDTRRISPEAPVPVVEVNSQEQKLGLGANVAQNLVVLGARATLVSVRGNDSDGIRVEQMLKEGGVTESVLITDPSRPTLRKVRVIAHRQHVVRIDYEKSHRLDAKLAKQFNDSICDQLPKCDGIIVQDYGKGLWNSDTMAFVDHAKALKRPIFVDPSRHTPASLYRGSTLLTPNIQEAEMLSGMLASPGQSAVGKDDEHLQKMGLKILGETAADSVVITCGEWGMISLSQGSSTLTRIPTFARDVFDVTGAGDTVVSVLALMSVLGHPLSRCMQIANAAAGIVVAKIGTASVTRDELKAELERLVSVGLVS
jgi:rfaE bifunctional protein kinase chain/domain